jgi:NTP pyrophosphatase (non-canonical NTP hydrolase)
MQINDMAKRHFKWVESMGWHNKSVLECLALIASEVGEAVNECRGETPTSELSTELADIILRVADLAISQGIDIEKVIETKMELNEQRGTRGRCF